MARNSKPGIVWHEASAEMVTAIKADRAAGLTFNQLEVKYGLRQNNGMSAHNIVNDKPHPKPKTPKAASSAPVEAVAEVEVVEATEVEVTA